MSRRGLPIVALLAVACSQATADAERAVTAELSDPASATFRNVAARSTSVCGEVNAKNKFGGYVGFRRFIYDEESKAAVIDPLQYLSADAKARFPNAAGMVTDTAAFDIRWARECG